MANIRTANVVKLGLIIAIIYSVSAFLLVGTLTDAYNAREASRTKAFKEALQKRSRIADTLINGSRGLSNYLSDPDYIQANSELDELMARNRAESEAETPPKALRAYAYRLGLLLFGIYSVVCLVLSMRANKYEA